ncbi:MAG: hypothetical protein ABL923_05515 [Burkholderiaceae bacterium]
MSTLTSADASSLWLKRSAYITAVLLVICAIAYMFDTRLVNGINVWTKPNKFNASFLMQLITVLLLWQLVEPAKRATKFAVGLMATLAISGLIEIFYIAFQSARGRASHFNNETAWEAFAYTVIMGGAAVVLVVTTSIVGVLIWRHATTAARKNKGLYWGAVLGLFLGGIATLITASAMASGQIAGPGHWVGGVRTDVGGLPILGWSTTGGDLRVPHFFATHLMQALPLAGLLADKFLPSQATLSVWMAAALGIVVVVLTFMQAVNGYSFTSFSL